MPTISERIVKELPVPERGNRLHYFSHARLQGRQAPVGFAIRVTAAGSKSFVWFHRVNGQSHLETIGRWSELPTGDSLSVVEAITAVQKRAKAVRDGAEDPRPERTRRSQDSSAPAGLTVDALIDKFVIRHVRPNLRTADQVEGVLNRLVKPRLGKLAIHDLRRIHISDMLDEISDENGPIMAERTLAYCSKLFNWHEVADDTFRNPVVKGMSRIKPSERARKRILSDDELKILWATTSTEQSFDRMIRFILLTATRRNEAANMVYSEVTDGVWTIPPERSKSKVEIVIPLSQAAQDILAAIPRTKNVDYVFAAGQRPIADFSRCKSRLDAKAGFTGWTIHDLRRTSRSLMARAGVSDEVGERCVGHILPGVLGIYNRHQYLDEKREAFGKLEAMVASIVLGELQ